MTATITWIVEQMDCYPQAKGQQNVAFNVHWRCNGTDGTYQATTYATCAVQYIAGSPYTPYDKLTQDEVLGWIWGSGVDKDATEASLAAQLSNLANPPVINPPLPWQARP